MNFLYSKQSEQLRQEFREWLKNNLHIDFDNRVEAEIRKELGIKLYEGGWGAPTLPKQYGGLGLTMEEHLVYLEELVAIGAPEVLNANAIGVFGPTFIKYGTEEQKNRYLPKMLSHEEIWCQGYSEPNAGSDLAALETKAEKKGDKYILNGQKIWTSNAQYADICYILVRTDLNAPKHKGITMMILEMDQPGVEVRPLKDIMGTEKFSELFLHDAIVPEENVVGEVNQGWKIAIDSLSNERSILMAQKAIGLGMEVKELIELYQEKVSNRDVLIEDKLVDSYINSEVVRAISLRDLLLDAQGELPPQYPSMSKLTWSEAHQDLANISLDVLEDEIMLTDSSHNTWMYRLLHSRAETIYGGTSEVQKNIISKIYGLPSIRGGN